MLPLFSLLLSSLAADWTYSGPSGPAFWGGDCLTGKAQSPIDVDLSRVSDGGRGGLLFLHPLPISSPLSVENTGKTAALNGVRGSLSFAQRSSPFSLQQLHLHVPAENLIGGKRYDMEMHMVHKSDSGETAVVGVLFEAVGFESPPLIRSFLHQIPVGPGESRVLQPLLDLPPWSFSFLPSNRSSLHWEGSLTTPPCTEGVQWFLFSTPVQFKKSDLVRFRTIFGENARPVQPLNGREVERWRGGEEE